MVRTVLMLTDEHYQFLMERAKTAGKSLDEVVAEILEREMRWQAMIENDPVVNMAGIIKDEDPYVSEQVDNIL